MKSLSLTQVTAFVVTVSITSFFFNIDHALAHITQETAPATIPAETTINLEVVGVETKTVDSSFTFSSLDADKDGKLSEHEVVAKQNEWLMKSFTHIDSNADKSLTEQELVNFATQATISNK